MSQLLTISLRQKAIYIPENAMVAKEKGITVTTGMLVANLAKLGFGVSEPLLVALNKTVPAYQAKILATCNEVMGTGKGWTPLVKGWLVPTGESIADHIATFFANLFGTKGKTMPCGHIIPFKTFPLHRYNGCPYCGTPFVREKAEQLEQGSHQKVLELWEEKELMTFMEDLLSSKTALDATQMDSLKQLLAVKKMPAVKIAMKETLMAVIEALVKMEQPEKAQALFTSPADVLRYLWYKHTGFLQIIEPKTIIKRKANNGRQIGYTRGKGKGLKAKYEASFSLKLKYTRHQALMVANWLNNLPMEIEMMCEVMHPKRSMWVRFIRALRLAEYSKRKGFEKLHAMLDAFYKKEYTVMAGEIDHARLRYDAAATFRLLQQRPGLFARSLFANMVWFGPELTTQAFAQVMHRVPARLLFTLEMYAEDYFNPANERSVKPLGGIAKKVPANQLLSLYAEDQLKAMRQSVQDLCLKTVMNRFAAVATESKTMYIDPLLYKMPVSIGDRSETLPGALMGARFQLEGDKVRLFMQWGTGLPAQRLDMDLSCMVAYDHAIDHCSYRALQIVGCKHSGDIIHIPHMTGAAEYIELDLAVLKKAGARYVMFTCNAYSGGAITPNLVVGWMNSRHEMKVSERTGVAYDPSTVQHQVRVVSDLTKGLLFGVLDVQAGEIIWLEMPFEGQVVQNLDAANVAAFLRKLNNKLTVGELLMVKAMAQKLQLVEVPEADEIYTREWAMNTAAVTKLLID
ncbi:hypothetical protein [Paraflavitalea sp. CAU 1676]|uniref:hypothetical protein n=1 Tax=Paraflavitalea sp. CAU 1676 TaxID=3032598 RepID=UPI0023DA1EF2|nr:hypothetical protein [Paraflavitalea sp. CAU 1676]MDF2191188.1 hypothetical protein [Paraflavitalea sp. CAU 1676]